MQKGDKFERSFLISEDIYNGFAFTFNDKNPLHMSDEYAQERGFERRVMHGNILNGFISYFVGECLPIKNVVIQTQEIKFFKPSYLNDKLLFEAEVVDFYESVKTIELKFVFKNQNNIKVASGKLNIGVLNS